MHLRLKLYYRYKYPKPCMINRIGGLKQIWLQVNGQAWFYLQRICWPVRNGEGAKNWKWKICLQRDSNPHNASPRQESERLRPLGHKGLMVISGLMSYRIMGYKFKKKTVMWQHVSTWLWLHVYLTEYQTKLSFPISL